MTTRNMTGRSDRCPYCGREYPIVTIPALLGVPERVLRSAVCGCEGERLAQADATRNARIAARAQTLRRTGIPRRYWDIPEDTTHLQSVEGGGLFVHGLVGRGKTWLAVATLKAWMNRNRGQRAVFTDANAFLSSIRAGYDRGESERESMWRYAGCDLLVYDDFGKGRPSEWSLSRVEELVQRRYEEGLPTIYTSQWSGSDLIARLATGGSEESAEAIVSRIAQTCATVELSGPDRRLADRK